MMTIKNRIAFIQYIYIHTIIFLSIMLPQFVYCQIVQQTKSDLSIGTKVIYQNASGLRLQSKIDNNLARKTDDKLNIKNSLRKPKSTANQLLKKSDTGGWESSGGSGVACFSTQSDKKIAAAQIEQRGYLSSLMRSRIQSITTLDYWDFFNSHRQSNGQFLNLSEFYQAQGFKKNSKLLDTASVDKILESVIDFVDQYVPMFSEKLRMVKLKSELKTWHNSDQIPVIQDRNPIVPIQDHCLLIQLAQRKTISRPGLLPELVMVYDKELVEKFLSKFDQALLVMHEYLYLIAKEGKHNNSDGVRKINAFLFSNEFTDATSLRVYRVPFSDRVIAIRQIVGYYFGDYMKFFDKEIHSQNELVINGTQQSRYYSFMSLMYKMREQMKICIDQFGMEAHWDCKKETIYNNSTLSEQLTPEEAFLLVARFHFDQMHIDQNSEELAVWNPKFKGEDSFNQIETVRFYCDLMNTAPAFSVIAVQDKAKKYCTDVYR